MRGPDSYGRGAIAFHWGIAMLIMLAAGLALFRETFAPQAQAMISAHKVVGLAVLFLSLGWLLWRWRYKPPPLAADLAPWARRTARVVHSLLLLFMVAVPAAGWIFSSAAPVGSPVDYAGWNSVPRLPLARDAGLAWTWHEIHELMGFAMIGLFLLHIAAALKHEFVDRDGTLGRVLPFTCRGKSPH